MGALLGGLNRLGNSGRFAEVTKHPAGDALEQPFVRYVENQPSRREITFAA